MISFRHADLLDALRNASNIVRFEVCVRPTTRQNGWINIFYKATGPNRQPTPLSDAFQERLHDAIMSHDDHSSGGSSNIFKSIVFSSETEANFNMNEIVNGIRHFNNVEDIKEDSSKIEKDETQYFFTVTLKKVFE